MITPLFSGWTQNKALLVSGNVLLGIALIILGNTHVLPLDPVNFIFFSFVIFLFALYRPGWAFLFFVGLMPFEIIHVAPVSFGIDVRPYQWVALLLFLAVILRFFAHKLPFDLVRPKWFDWLLLVIPVGALIAIVNAPFLGSSLKQALVVFSFGLVYAVGRIFWQSWEDVKQSIPFFITSSFVVLSYALWQNIRFLFGKESFQVMTGRPNATFSEADWLGLFVVIVLSILATFVFRMFFSEEQEQKERSIPERVLDPKAYFLLIFLIFTFIILIITVARSAWLGTFFALAMFCLSILFSQGVGGTKKLFHKVVSFGSIIVVSLMIAFGVVTVFHLTPFHLFDRASSTVSGLQTITLACDQHTSLPMSLGKIENLDQISEWGCEYITLEDIESQRAAGKFITTVQRDDPNISIRQEIYAKVRQKIREFPLLGIGWGSIAAFLGTDERGAGLNASNMFFEIWLGSGFMGLVAFVIFWGGLMVISFWRLPRSSGFERGFILFLIASWAGISVFNMFNSGILLGFFFLYLALGGLILEEQGKNNKD